LNEQIHKSLLPNARIMDFVARVKWMGKVETPHVE
jgi:hypothetical protein